MTDTVRFWRDSDIAGVEVRYSSYCEEAFRKHAHAGYSVGLILSGQTTFYLEGDYHVAMAGKLVYFQPEAVHACNPDPESTMEYVMFYVEREVMADTFRDIFTPAGGSVPMPVFPAPVVDDREVFAMWHEVYRAVMSESDGLEKQSRLFQAMSASLRRHAGWGTRELVAQCSGNAAEGVHRAKAFLAENLCRKVSLGELAEVAGLSRYHLLRTFHGETGLPPHTYHNQLRVDRGKKLLAQGASISDVAAELGFTDQSHFTRVFKQFTAATPRQYQLGASAF